MVYPDVKAEEGKLGYQQRLAYPKEKFDGCRYRGERFCVVALEKWLNGFAKCESGLS